MSANAELRITNKTKPTTRLKLVLLPPEQQNNVGYEDIKNFYKNLTNILMCDN